MIPPPLKGKIMPRTGLFLKRLFPFSLPITIKRRSKGYLPEQGWELSGGLNPQWNGYYRTRFGSYKGRVVPKAEPNRRYFIHNPPESLRNHHWACFTEMKGMEQGGWYAVHLLPFPKDIDSGVLAIERVIDEAYKKPKAA
jgi:hypothetical protein